MPLALGVGAARDNRAGGRFVGAGYENLVYGLRRDCARRAHPTPPAQRTLHSRIL